MQTIQLIYLICALLGTALCAPYEAYPVPKQIPPVARTNQQFVFQISNDTYKSNVNDLVQISYQTYDLPKWLTFNTDSRTIQGLPPSDLFNGDNQVQYFKFILEGTDESDNSKLNNTYQLVVTNKPAITLSPNFNLLALLKNSGYTNGKNGLILTPNQIFNVTFDRSNFDSSDEIVAYYGRTDQYNAPLPNWVFFDPANLKFSGSAPVVNSQIAPQTAYDLTLIATDIDGYAGIEVPFELVIGAHTLTTSIQNTLVINVTETGNISYKVPLNYVYYDDAPITTNNLGSLNLVNNPAWIRLNNDTIEGTVPQDMIKSANGPIGNFSVVIYDINGDVIYLNFEVEATTKLFATSSLPNLNATRGEWFYYNFLPSQFTDFDNTNVSVKYEGDTDHDWLNFVSSNLTLMGRVPQNFQRLTIDLVAQKNSLSQQLPFTIIGMDKLTTNHTNITTSANATNSSTLYSSTRTSATHSKTSDVEVTSTSTESSSAVAPLSKASKKHSTKTAAIACGVAIPVVVIILVVLAFLFYRSKKKTEPKDEEKTPNISPPNPYNPANNPNKAATSLENPFEDDSDADSAKRRLDMLNALKLDDASTTDSDTSTMDEKRSNKSDIFYDTNNTNSRDLLLEHKDTNSTFFEPNIRSSSVYVDSIPAHKKSWRYTLASARSSHQPGNIRDSYSSLNTVSTAELMNTTISDEADIPKDPRKSTLGLRDSVFLDMGSKKKGNLTSSQGNSFSSQMLSESSGHSSQNIPHDTSMRTFERPILEEEASDKHTPGTVSSSSTDDFVPVKNGTSYEWVSKNSPNRKPSVKRFVDISNSSNINVSQAGNFEGHSPEHI
ncbi:Transmembrane alpha-helix domain [Nakaseomyces glabratus]|nr:Transmembrane alpha-helix domain [Nakaseomyces glabratus]KAH7582893.1 Transmembrane alpha-helix domain [Nakaseomyces glabratus]OXB40841.1 hypothetical protein B1J91_L08294g [Nakaseomyces glabratus]OXB46141.1 hypothetical protein B1J92_L08294g [Nakaseomyces glabratus]